jgi:cyclophilin family peptidyl-prolyl cis-trans isomerase
VLALAGDANGNVAASALVLLRWFAGKDRGVFHRLWSIATTGEGRRRQVALLSVVAVLKSKADTAISAAANSADASLRATAAESLAFLPAAEAKPYRDRLSGDRDPLVRLAVLGSLKTAEAVQQNRELVNSAFTDSDAGVRAAAVDELALLADPATLPLIQEAADKSRADTTPDVSVAVIGSCEKLREDPGSRRIVESLYARGPTLTSRLARRALVDYFRVDPFAFPAPEYKTGRTVADYTALLAEAKKPWQATVETSRGTFAIRLAGADAPLTVLNFVRLAQQKFFDGVLIHRVVPNFVLQDGDPTGTGNGGPGYEIRDEINVLEYGRGAVGMALSGPDTGGSQWFVTHSPQPHLNAIYTIFGQVVSGQDVVERVEQWDRVTRVTVTSGS